MLSKEERNAIRAQYSDYIAYECAMHGGIGVSGTGHEKGHHEFLEWLADGGLPYLLDALDETEEEINSVRKFIREDISVSDLYKKIRSLEDSRASKIRELKKVTSDRDYWKARAKTLERDDSQDYHCTCPDVSC